MTLNQILRRIRRQPDGPQLTPEARAFLDERKGALDGWTDEQLDELTARTAAAHEAELRQAIREMNDPQSRSLADE